MTISRRSLFQGLAAAAAASGTAVDSVLGVSLPTRSRPFPSPAAPAPVLLDHNENAYGPSEKVRAVLAQAPLAGNRYPREEYDALRAKLAALHSVKDDRILLGCGSTEILRMAASAFVSTAKRLVQALPTYATLARYAHAAGGKVVEVPLTKLFAHDLDAMLAHVGNGNSTGLVYIVNPNNPTGTLTVRKDIDAFLQKLPPSVYVLIDEAYSHFVHPHLAYSSFLDQPIDDPRLIICRTFSKVYGLAGMRIGYAVGSPEALKRLAATQLRYGVSRIAALAAIAALDDPEYVKLAIHRNSDDRQEFMNQVNTRMLRPIDSHTNFAMLDPLRHTPMVIEHLKKNNVVVPSPFPPMENYIRVSLGTPAEMQEFWRVMDLLPPPNRMAM